MTDDERRKLVSTQQSLDMDAAEPRLPSAIEGLESFSASPTRGARTTTDEDDRESDDGLSRTPTASSTCPATKRMTPSRTTTAAAERGPSAPIRTDRSGSRHAPAARLWCPRRGVVA